MAASPVLHQLTSPPATLFTLKLSSHRPLSLPSSPIRPLLRLSLYNPTSPLTLLFSPRNKLPFLPLVAQTSDWARQEEENATEDDGLDWAEGDEDLEHAEGDEDIEHAEGRFVAQGEPEGGDGFSDGPYSEPPEEAKLFVGGLPFDIDSEKLAQLFDKAGVVEVAEVIYNRETDQSRGFGFVTMSTVEEAEKGVEMFRQYEIGGRQLTVNKAAPRGSRPERNPQISDPLRVYVGNLPWQVDDARLEQLFSEHGEVVSARVVCDRETGRSRGFGFVAMSAQTGVDDAIAALDGKSVDGRAIRVNVAEERGRRSSF